MSRRPGAPVVALVTAVLWLGGRDALAGSFRLQDLFSNPAIAQVLVSPTGEWVVAVASHAEVWGLVVQRRGDGVPIPIYASPSLIQDAKWVGADTLFLRHPESEARKAVVIRLQWDGWTVVHDELHVTRPGRLVDPLPDQDEVVLWASDFRRGSKVERGPIAALAPGARWKISGAWGGGELTEVARLEQPVVRWQTDRRGRVRAALALASERDPIRVLVYRSAEDEAWREVWRARDRDDMLIPIGTTADDRRLVVAAYGSGDTLGLHEFDPESGQLGRTLFVRPDVDVIDAVFDYAGKEIIAAVYEEDGRRRYHYLSSFGEEQVRGIEGIAPGQGVTITSASRDRRFLALLVEGTRNPGTFHFFDEARGKQTPLGAVIPGIAPDLLVDVRSIGVVAPDGTKSVAFLALPEAADGRPPPLLVLPHGGPLGVRDDDTFDPLLQYLAIGGIAVLKVNYRGSGGYGRTFLEAGKREWSRGIEDDIDAAVDAVVDRGLVDARRICIAGGSYGGYSALMSAIRRPDRYRCAATLNGPMDVPLLFQSSDFAATRQGRDALAEMVGDPGSDFDRLIEISPVYRVEELQGPVLIVHGSRDTRVDPDHAHRLRAMLELHHKPYEWLELHDGEHSPTSSEWQTYAGTLLAFLRRNLEPRGAIDARD